MPHNFKQMPPLWCLKDKVELTDEHPSGLRIRKNGKFVTRKDKATGFYVVSIDNVVYLAHRVVYYLRTGKSPDQGTVKHAHPNPDFDNRKELVICYKSSTKRKKPSWSFDYKEWS